MKETGKVIDLKGEVALIELARSQACKSCGICHVGTDAKKMLTEAVNLAHADIGEDVYIELEPKNILVASFVVYVLPLFFLIIGYLVGMSFTSFIVRQNLAEVGGIITGFLALVFSYMIIRTIDKRISKAKRFEPIITEVIRSKTGKGE